MCRRDGAAAAAGGRTCRPTMMRAVLPKASTASLLRTLPRARPRCASSRTLISTRSARGRGADTSGSSASTPSASTTRPSAARRGSRTTPKARARPTGTPSRRSSSSLDHERRAVHSESRRVSARSEVGGGHEADSHRSRTPQGRSGDVSVWTAETSASATTSPEDARGGGHTRRERGDASALAAPHKPSAALCGGSGQEVKEAPDREGPPRRC
mmetsp:Transcript_17906/g.71780  ORF Transcript_17906/g.71780 Transcript_17906/m.71780 type:complete len:214 (+) Transcript_17906:821-1462(+)